MVYDDVQHEVHPAHVQRIAERLEVVRGAEVGAYHVDVARPVPAKGVSAQRSCGMQRRSAPVIAISVRRVVDVFDDGRDPDGVKAHVLDVVEVVRDARP